MKAQEISAGIYCIHADICARTSRFEGLWMLPQGVSINSYIVKGEKTALIDIVRDWDGSLKSYTEQLESIGLSFKDIDYLILNHLEPDHCDLIEYVHSCNPQAEVISTSKGLAIVEKFFKVQGNLRAVKTGDCLDLGGGKVLQFYETPNVHWPETMMTLCEGQKSILFSGDGFGSFGALNGGLIDSEINTDWCWDEMMRYYSNIVGKYGIPVQNALKKLAGIHIDYICSTHGPVWHEHVEKVVEMYDRMSKYETSSGLVICYGTMYGNTERMAEHIARAASLAGVKDIVMYNVSKTHHSYIIRDVFKFRGLIVGAPTYNTGLYHEMDVLLSEIANHDVKNHLIGWFGSYAWASKAVNAISEWNEKRLHFEQVGEPVEMKQALTPEVKAECERLGREMALKLLQA